jgi:hypothetical protein
MKISENSLICATVNPARKPVRLRYPMAPMIASTISGLPISTNSDSTIAGPTLRAKNREVERRAERDEEEQQQEVAQRGKARGDGLANGVEARDTPASKAAQFLAEPKIVSDGSKQGRPADGEGHQQLRRPR